MTWMVRPVLHWRFEHDPLVVALALAFRLDAVPTGWSLFTALDAALAASEAAGLGTFPHLCVGRRPSVSRRRDIASTIC